MKNRIPGIALIVVLLIIWEVVVSSGMINSPSIPKVSTIFKSWFSLIFSGEIFSYLGPSLLRIFYGFFLAILVGVPLGLLIGTNRWAYSLLEPLIELIRPIPSAAYVPVAILFLGIGDTMKVFVVFLACLFPILLNTYGGVKGVDPTLIDTGRTFGNSKGRILRSIVLPSVMPEIFTGMRISLGIGLIVVVVAEMIAGNNGIGYFILDKQQFFRVAEMFGGIFTLAIIGYLLNWLFLRVEKRLLRWRSYSH
jgi:ABC-type nitrate/sulfonate/bicarbonate transport system permease component